MANPSQHYFTGHRFPVIEILHDHHEATERVDHRWAQADLGTIGLRAVIGARAFREYHTLSNAIGLNRAGDLRGMVVSSKWKTVFQHTSNVGEYMENIGYMIAVAAGIAESTPRIESILGSADSTTGKGARLAGIALTIAQRAYLGVVPEGAHLIYRALEGWCLIGSMAMPKAAPAASSFVNTLHEADAFVHSSFQILTDTSNQLNAFKYVVNLVRSRRR